MVQGIPGCGVDSHIGEKLPVLDDRYRVTLDIKGKKLIGSAPELAAYELLSAVPGTFSFNHAAELFRGLVNLNPRKVEYLLSVSQSVQAKRLYLFFASFTSMAGSNESIAKNRSGSGQAANRGKWKVQCSIPNHSA